MLGRLLPSRTVVRESLHCNFDEILLLSDLERLTMVRANAIKGKVGHRRITVQCCDCGSRANKVCFKSYQLVVHTHSMFPTVSLSFKAIRDVSAPGKYFVQRASTDCNKYLRYFHDARLQPLCCWCLRRLQTSLATFSYGVRGCFCGNLHIIRWKRILAVTRCWLRELRE